MRLGLLNEKLQTHDASFVQRLITENLDEVDTIKEIKDRLKEIMSESNTYAEDNNFKYKYLELAQEPLWVDVMVESEHFIYQGFDAYVSIDLKENIDDITPYVVIQNNNVSSLKDGQTIEINEEFKSSLNDLQREIFEEALSKVETKTVKTLKKVWQFEKQRMDKWIKTCAVELKGSK